MRPDSFLCWHSAWRRGRRRRHPAAPPPPRAGGCRAGCRAGGWEGKAAPAAFIRGAAAEPLLPGAMRGRGLLCGIALSLLLRPPRRECGGDRVWGGDKCIWLPEPWGGWGGMGRMA